MIFVTNRTYFAISKHFSSSHLSKNTKIRYKVWGWKSGRLIEKADCLIILKSDFNREKLKFFTAVGGRKEIL